ncbi:hypothetical protein B0H15DRAFT_871692 [Mycena belliarum]|uniref:Secreted protein n=1 Tax=Mycena belliarum TaxID=1033014 RepID=A0AAD6TQW6_9AGAR|nr:hypothetical protein B0H15DRAFT_871692 [Mycena belliae]
MCAVWHAMSICVLLSSVCPFSCFPNSIPKTAREIHVGTDNCQHYNRCISESGVCPTYASQWWRQLQVQGTIKTLTQRPSEHRSQEQHQWQCGTARLCSPTSGTILLTYLLPETFTNQALFNSASPTNLKQLAHERTLSL